MGTVIISSPRMFNELDSMLKNQLDQSPLKKEKKNRGSLDSILHYLEIFEVVVVK